MRLKMQYFEKTKQKNLEKIKKMVTKWRGKSEYLENKFEFLKKFSSEFFESKVTIIWHKKYSHNIYRMK